MIVYNPILNDSSHTYTWDAEGRPLTVDGVGLTYDALGRMVEQNRSGAYTQIVYSPSGGKLPLMNAQTLQKALVPLSGKAMAAYNSSGLSYYAHADFLGSVRLASTPARTMYFDLAYAPFGETYAQSGSVEASYTGQRDDTGHRQDTAGGLYDFPLREYSTQGRWPSPDPAGRAATCPKDPQTQNRYAYVRNNPMSFVDPLGAQPCDPFLDPFCPGGGEGRCSPFDPFCNPFLLLPIIRFPGGGGGGGGVERPRLFPFQLAPAGFLNSLRELFRLPGCAVELAFCLKKVRTIIGEIRDKNDKDFDHCIKDCNEGDPFKKPRCYAGCLKNYTVVEIGAGAAKATGIAVCAAQFGCCLKGLDKNCNGPR